MINNKLTTIVLTNNDESRIVDCLDNLGFSNELIIIDDNSTDRTVELCKRFTTKIYSKALNDNFSNQRNYALNFASNEWVLFVDSDEFVSDKLAKEIVEVTQNHDVAGYYLRRVDMMWGQKILHGEGGQTKLLRLAKKKNGKWHGKVHETWKIRGRVGELHSPLIHIPHPSISEFLSEIDKYSTLRSEELAEKKVKSGFLEIITFPVAKFVLNYLVKQGYKDGVAGLLYSVMMSFHSFLVRGKLFLLKKNNDDFTDD